MNNRKATSELVLAVYPSAKGFGFAVFEGQKSLVDWGVKHVRGQRKNVQNLRKFQDLLDFYRPDTVVIRPRTGTHSHQGVRIRQLISAMADLAKEKTVPIAMLSRSEIRSCFANRGARTKQEISEVIAREFAELEPRLPPVRRIWMSEDARMNIFDAVALGMTFFHTKRQTNRAA